MIYFDNAATTAVDIQVADAITEVLYNTYGNPSSVHALGREAKVLIEKSRKKIAELLEVAPSEIFFTAGGTEAINTIIFGLYKSSKIKQIITSPIEHHAVLHSIEQLNTTEINVSKLMPTSDGTLNISELNILLANNIPTLVCLMHANNEIGTLLPLKEVGELCRQYNAYFMTDTVQTVGKFKIFPQKLGIDFMTCSAHKLYGPKGIGFMCINGKNQIPPLVYGGGQERNMRSGTENVAYIVGLAKAMEIAYENMELWQKKIQKIKSYAAEQLKANFPYIEFIANSDKSGLYTILSLAFPKNEKTTMLLYNLDMEHIAVSGGSACASGALGSSHVIEALGIKDKVVLRLSFSKNNELSEVDTFINKLKKLLV